MTKSRVIELLTPFLTRENALKYSAQTDKYLWVEYNILDEAGISANDARVNWVEDRFDAILAGMKKD